MSLFPCRECGHQVSSEAPTCPSCGAPSPTRAGPAPNSAVVSAQPVSFRWPGTVFVILTSLGGIVAAFYAAGILVSDAGGAAAGVFLFLVAGFSIWLAWGVLKHKRAVFWPLVIVLAFNTAVRVYEAFGAGSVGSLVSAAISGGFLWYFWKHRAVFGAEQGPSLDAERESLGVASMIAGYLVLLAAGGWALILDARILVDAGGFWAVVVGAFFLPFTVNIVPFYAIATDGNWLPFFVTYGGALLGFGLMALGATGRD